MKEGFDLIHDFYKSLRSKEEPPPPIPPAVQKQVKKNKKGHISVKPPALFFEE
jgi:hypothetical protein